MIRRLVERSANKSLIKNQMYFFQSIEYDHLGGIANQEHGFLTWVWVYQEKKPN